MGKHAGEGKTLSINHRTIQDSAPTLGGVFLSEWQTLPIGPELTVMGEYACRKYKELFPRVRRMFTEEEWQVIIFFGNHRSADKAMATAVDANDLIEVMGCGQQKLQRNSTIGNVAWLTVYRKVRAKVDLPELWVKIRRLSLDEAWCVLMCIRHYRHVKAYRNGKNGDPPTRKVMSIRAYAKWLVGS